MKKIKGFISLIVSLAVFLSAVPIFSISAETENTAVSVSPAASSLSRMWTNNSYATGDHLSYGSDNNYIYKQASYHYLRFIEALPEGTVITKATVSFDVRTREADREALYLAAVAIGDSAALRKETDLTSSSATLIKTNGSSATDKKLMTDTSGYYLSDVVSNVAAYAKITAGETAVDTDVVDDVYVYPASVSLDVTKTVGLALKAGNHVQLALLGAKQVYDNEGNLLSAYDGFSHYQNGTVYNQNGEVLSIGPETAKLTSSTVAGGQKYYYSGDKTPDPYFSYMYIVPDSIKLNIEYTEAEDYADYYKQTVGSVASVEELKDYIKKNEIFFLSDDIRAQYMNLSDDEKLTALNEVFEYITSGETDLSGFKSAYANAVDSAYWQGYGYRLGVSTRFGAAAGEFSVEAKSGYSVPLVSYAKLTTFDSDGNSLYSEIIKLNKGAGNYDIFEREERITYIKVYLASDKTGETRISPEGKITVEDTTLVGDTLTLNIGSYNIANGRECSFSMQTLANDILKHNLDIVGLQEVDSGATRSGLIDMIKELSEYTGYKYYYFNMSFGHSDGVGQCGTAVLSKYHITASQNYKLTSTGLEQRALAYTEINVRGTKLYFATTHLSYNSEGSGKGADMRLTQYNDIYEILKGKTPCILTGDFNETDYSNYDILDFLNTTVNEENSLVTFEPSSHLDNILYSEDFSITSSAVENTGHSDHNLLYGTYTMTVQEPSATRISGITDGGVYSSDKAVGITNENGLFYRLCRHRWYCR